MARVIQDGREIGRTIEIYASERVEIEINSIRYGLETMGQGVATLRDYLRVIVKYGLDSIPFLGKRGQFFACNNVRVILIRVYFRSTHSVSFHKYSRHEYGSTVDWKFYTNFHVDGSTRNTLLFLTNPRAIFLSSLPSLFHHLLRLVPRVQLHQHIDGPPFWSQFSHSRAKLKCESYLFSLSTRFVSKFNKWMQDRSQIYKHRFTQKEGEIFAKKRNRRTFPKIITFKLRLSSVSSFLVPANGISSGDGIIKKTNNFLSFPSFYFKISKKRIEREEES